MLKYNFAQQLSIETMSYRLSTIVIRFKSTTVSTLILCYIVTRKYKKGLMFIKCLQAHVSFKTHVNFILSRKNHLTPNYNSAESLAFQTQLIFRYTIIIYKIIIYKVLIQCPFNKYSIENCRQTHRVMFPNYKSRLQSYINIYSTFSR